MNGPEHYREAERLLRGRTEYFNGGQTRRDYPPSPENVATAQVHATLALAAATIDAAAHPNQSQVDYLGAWWEAGV